MLHEVPPACHAPIVGVDVGKATLVIYESGAVLSLRNDPACIAGWLAQHPGVTLALEATGGYEAALIEATLASGGTVYRVNARRVRAFMESRGVLAKTDALDARAIADYAVRNRDQLTPYLPPDDALRTLRHLVRRRDELLAMHTQEANRRQAPDLNPAMRRSLDTVLRCLKRQITQIEAQLTALLKDVESLKETSAILTGVDGVGRVTALALLAHLPEIGRITGKKITALAGLAPRARDSGSIRGYRRIGPGRREVRRALYMAALSASRCNDVLRQFYQRLCANGKKPLQALLAVARKLLVILNAKLRDYLKNKTHTPALLQQS